MVLCNVKIPTGVISACQNGIYIGQDVQAIACEKGWRYSKQFEMVMKDDATVDAETYTWAWDEAEQFLNDKVAEENHYFGSDFWDCGCWGYWEHLPEEKALWEEN